MRHTFYEKPLASPLVFHSRSAYNWKAKVVTLSEEVKRRLMNMDLYHSEAERVEVLTTFLGKMANSQYGPPTRKEVLKSGIRRYYRKVYAQETGGPKLYRTKEELERGRRFKELLNKHWFR